MSLPEAAARRVLAVACGALARELLALTRDVPGVEVAFLPALLHNRPDGIPGAVRERVRAARTEGTWDEVFVAYADCGTGGLLDRVCEEEGVRRLEGAHCYEIYAGRAAFAALHDEEPGTFYLTDYLVRSFEGLIIRGLGLDRHPELLPIYFGNYRRLVYLAQADDEALDARARRAADRLGLAFELRRTGYGELGPAIRGLVGEAGEGALRLAQVTTPRGNERELRRPESLVQRKESTESPGPADAGASEVAPGAGSGTGSASDAPLLASHASRPRRPARGARIRAVAAARPEAAA